MYFDEIVELIDMISSEEEEETNSHSENLVDLDDLIIIDNYSNWDPPKEYILTYAKDLGFKADYDPPQLLNIFKKYLIKPIPSDYIRAFYRDNFHLIYINVNTSQIIFEMGFEEEIKEEYLKAKKELDEIKNQNEFLLKLKYNKEPNNYYII